MKCTIVCRARDASCLNEDCAAPKIDTRVCFQSSVTAKQQNFIYGQEQYNNRISAQSVDLGSATIALNITDYKYNIPGPEGRLVPQVWNLRLVFDIGEALCVIAP